MSRRNSGQVKPKKVKGQMALRTQFYRRLLFNETQGIFDVKVPDDWDYSYTIQSLMKYGLITITDSPIGLKPFRCSTYGVNYMNYPTNVNISTPIIKQTLRRRIGRDCEILYLDKLGGNNFWTFNPLIDIYANMLALIDSAFSVNIINSKLAYLAEAQTKAQAETIQAMFDEIEEGNPLVVYRSGTIDMQGINLLSTGVKQNFIAGDLQDVKRTIINEYLTRLGVNNANTDKKERLITNEVESNNQELICSTQVWATNIEIQMKKIHKMFPELKDTFDIKLKFREETIKSNELKRDNSTMGANAPGKEPVRRNDTA